MHYSEHPHQHYITDGVGPGAGFLGDEDMWNWRWLLHGERLDNDVDAALPMFFNDSQRMLMGMEPQDAAEVMDSFLSKEVMEGVWERAVEAQDRLYQSIVTTVKSNVIHANFRR